MNNNMVKKDSSDNDNFDEEEKVEEKEADIDTFEDDDDEDDDYSPSSSDDNKKKLFRRMGFIVFGAIILILVIYLITLVFNGNRSYSYETVEDILSNAAVSYFEDYPDYLPTTEGGVVEVDADNLIATGKMKDLSAYLKDGDSCTASVQVELAAGEYLYRPYLDCGENYTTVEFYKKIVQDSTPVSSGYGLYANNGSYIFRGEIVNNYVQFEDSTWRIVKITPNHNVVLISDGIPVAQPWDDRYNETALYEAGHNNYGSSRVKEYLDKVYKTPDKDDGEVILTDKEKTKIVSFNQCIGKRDANNETTNNSVECASVLNNQRLGLLTLSDYIYASVDPECKSAATKSCKNYNYLAISSDWWLATADSNSNSNVYMVNRGGIIYSQIAANYATVRPVIYLSDSTYYKSGKGTKEDPYVIK